MSKTPIRPYRSVSKYDDQCCVCWEPIPKNTCISKMFNYRSHKQCEPEMVDKFEASAARGRRPSVAKSV